ncbi:MAG: hypothetical protein ABI693_18070 [Bryobacteraceae bacterium]
MTATLHNSVYAFDADATAGTPPVWKVNLGAPVSPSDYDFEGYTFTDIKKEIGVLSTPVIDRASGTVYVANVIQKDGSHAFFLHALDLRTGAEKFNGPVEIQATVEGTGWGGVDPSENGHFSFDPTGHIQRPGLLLSQGVVYVAFGSHGDIQPFHGWLMGYNATDLQLPPSVLCTTPLGAGASIWQSGRGIAADPDGEIYLSTGNGSYDGWKQWGQSVLHISPKNGLSIVDWFTPAEWSQLNDDDTDVGSVGPILVPGQKWLIAGGKSGQVALMDRAKMGQEWVDGAGLVQKFKGVQNDYNFGIFNAALWNRPDGQLLYVWGFGDSLRSYRIENGQFNPTAASTNRTLTTSLPFSGFTVSSNFSVPDSGILWVTTVNTNGGGFPAPGTLHALDAMDLTRELWNSDLNAARDSMGSFTKFANPTVANGKVFVPTDSEEIVMYGLLPVPGVAAVVNAASLRPAEVSPGEVVSIFGFLLDTAVESVEDLRVTFDGIPAPIVYAQSGQINAIVPFGIAGRESSTLVVTTKNAWHTTPVPVAAATPAIFTLDASGAGPGAIVNADGTVNSAANPALRGSVVSVYATGTGLLVPTVTDGEIIALDSPPMLALPATVTIGGVAATVKYQGAAPGLIAGVTQINVEIPMTANAGASLPIRLAVGGRTSRNGVTLAIQ